MKTMKIPSSCFSVTVSSGAKTLSELIAAALPTNSDGTAVNSVLIQCETNAIRVRYDGSAPTDTVGILLSASGTMDFTECSYLIGFIKLIRNGSTDAKVNLHFYNMEA